MELLEQKLVQCAISQPSAAMFQECVGLLSQEYACEVLVLKGAIEVCRLEDVVATTLSGADTIAYYLDLLKHYGEGRETSVPISVTPLSHRQRAAGYLCLFGSTHVFQTTERQVLSILYLFALQYTKLQHALFTHGRYQIPDVMQLEYDLCNKEQTEECSIALVQLLPQTIADRRRMQQVVSALVAAYPDYHWYYVEDYVLAFVDTIPYHTMYEALHTWQQEQGFQEVFHPSEDEVVYYRMVCASANTRRPSDLLHKLLLVMDSHRSNTICVAGEDVAQVTTIQSL